MNLREGEMNLIYNATSIPSALMGAASVEQDFLCRVFGKCVEGGFLDRELKTMVLAKGDLAGGLVAPKLFTYARYNAELTKAGLQALGLPDIRPEDVQRLDSIESQGDDGLGMALHRESGAIYRRLQMPSGMASCLEGLGRIAARQSQAERAARWLAVAAGLRQAHGAPVPPGERTAYEGQLAALRQSLGEAAFAAVWAAGQAQSWEQALADATWEAPSS